MGTMLVLIPLTALAVVGALWYLGKISFEGKQRGVKVNADVVAKAAAARKAGKLDAGATNALGLPALKPEAEAEGDDDTGGKKGKKKGKQDRKAKSAKSKKDKKS